MATNGVATITLRCKVPPGHISGDIDEFNLGSFATSAKIGAVRERIQQQLPGNPTPVQQRILHGGRALVDDEQSLADALNVKRDPTQDTYVVHLLVRGNGASTPAPASQRIPVPGVGSVNPRPGQSPTPQQIHPGDARQGNAHQLPQQQPQQPFLNQHVDPLIAHQRLHAQFVQQQHQQNQHAFSPFPHGFPGMPPRHNHGQTPHTVPGQPGSGEPPRNPGGLTSQPDAHDTPSSARPDTNSTPNSIPQPPVNAPHLAAGLPNPMHRPISGQGFHVEGVGQDGQRFSVHQQTFSIPVGGPQFGVPGMPGLPPFPGTAQRPATVPSLVASAAVAQAAVATDRARQASSDVNQSLQTLLAREDLNEDQRARVREILDGAQRANGQATQARSALTQVMMAYNAPQMPTVGPLPPFGRPQETTPQHNSLPTIRTPSELTCYLLSAPDGPRAILYSPQHGTYHGNYNQGLSSASLLGQFASRSQQAEGAGVPPAPGAGQAGNLPNQGIEIQLPAELQPAEPAGPMQAILGHFWFLARIMIFAYFLLGSNMGWRRPFVLTVIGIGFWMIRMGLFGDGGLLRRWWDEIMQGPRPAQARAADGQADGQGAQDGVGAARPARMPTPEELAQRLLNQAARGNGNAAMNPQMRWLREQVRPAERAAALFVGSLWPGVGEAAVRAREQEERRLAEEEIAARRREEEERQRENEARDVKESEGSKAEEKATLEQNNAASSAAVDQSSQDAGAVSAATTES